MLVKHNNNFFFFTPLFILDILTKGHTSTVFQPIKRIKEIDLINEGEDIKVEPEFYLTKDGVVKSLTV